MKNSIKYLSLLTIFGFMLNFNINASQENQVSEMSIPVTPASSQDVQINSQQNEQTDSSNSLNQATLVSSNDALPSIPTAPGYYSNGQLLQEGVTDAFGCTLHGETITCKTHIPQIDPIEKYNLKPVDSSMQFDINGIHVIAYTGRSTYPVPADEASTEYSDLLIPFTEITPSTEPQFNPFSENYKIITLPSQDHIAFYLGLASDLIYKTGFDGSIISPMDRVDFENSPIEIDRDGLYSVNSERKDQLYMLNKIKEVGIKAQPDFVLPQPLIDYVQTNRTAWVSWITNKIASLRKESAPVSWTGTSNTLKIIDAFALMNNLYIYSCTPNPSTLSQDYFVLVNSSAPLATDETLGSMKAIDATNSTNMLSIVSGLLYDSSGAQIKNEQNITYQLNQADFMQTIMKNKIQGMSKPFLKKLIDASQQYKSLTTAQPTVASTGTSAVTTNSVMTLTIKNNGKTEGDIKVSQADGSVAIAEGTTIATIAAGQTISVPLQGGTTIYLITTPNFEMPFSEFNTWFSATNPTVAQHDSGANQDPAKILQLN